MDQIPRMADLLTPAIDALLGDLTGVRRAARERYAQSGPTGGRYGDIVRGWRGQAEVIRARLTKEVMATRLDRSSGQELADLAHSEYFAELPNIPQKAVGESSFFRIVQNTNSTTSANFIAGVIPAGTKLKVLGNPLASPPTVDAEYQLTEPVVCSSNDNTTPQDLGAGNWQHLQVLQVKIEATREGPFANTPFFPASSGANVPTLSGSKLFDPLLNVGPGPFYLQAAGGTLGVVDDQIRALARAMATGSNGPTQGALIAGALTNQGVRHTFYLSEPTAGVALLYVADESWATSDNYQNMVLQSLHDNKWIGWGCRVSMGVIANIGINVIPTVMLRSANDVSVQDITANITAALVEYFDDRPDFYTWTLNAIGSIVGGADDRILACTAVTVNDINGALIAAVDSLGNVTGTEPAPTVSNFAVRHYQLLGQAVNPSYQAPGA